MIHRLLALTGAVLLCGSLLAGPLAASNMGFKAERTLENIQSSRSLYLISLPFFRAMDDLTSFPGNGMEAGPPDGIVTAADLLFDWYTWGDGTCDGDGDCDGEITLSTFEADPRLNPNQLPDTLTITPLLFGLGFIGTDFSIGHESFPGRADERPRGYLAIAAEGSFPSVILGAHDPEFGGGEWVIPWYASSRNLHFFSLPPHTTFTTASELLTAIWDAAEDEEEIVLQTFENDPAVNPAQTYTDCTIRPSFPPNGQPDLTSCTDFPLVPGQAYALIVASGGSDELIRVPLSHY